MIGYQPMDLSSYQSSEDVEEQALAQMSKSISKRRSRETQTSGGDNKSTVESNASYDKS